MVAFSGANSNSGSLKLNGEWSSIESLPRYLFLCVRRADCAQQKAPSFEPIVNNRQTSHVTSFGFAFWQYCSWGKVFNILLTDHFLTFLYFRALGIWVLKNGKGQQKRQCNVACEPLYTLIFHQITVTCHLLCFRFGTDLPPLRTGHSVRRREVTARLPGSIHCVQVQDERLFRMAEAGFYACGGDNEPDLARCYFCRCCQYSLAWASLAKDLSTSWAIFLVLAHIEGLFLRKELDGWDPEDDPWAEHVSHAKVLTIGA